MLQEIAPPVPCVKLGFERQNGRAGLIARTIRLLAGQICDTNYSMKNIILALTLLGFVAAVQADEAKPAPTQKPACCAKTKVAAEKTQCPMASKQAKTCCAATQQAKQTVQSPKGFEQAKK